MLVALVFLLISNATIPAEKTVSERGLLWQIEAPGYPISYLFGTIHSEDKRVLQLPTAVSEALKTSEALIIEAPVDEEAEVISLRAMMFQDGTNLSDVVTPALYERTVAAMVENGFPEPAVKLLKPWAISIILSVPRPQTGMFLDLYLTIEATNSGMPVKALETVTEQIEILDGFNMDEQIAMLEDTLDDLSKIAELHEQLIQAYLQRDLEQLMEISEQAMGTGTQSLRDKLSDRLIVSRNRRMVKRLEPLLHNGKVFVAVGALHLPGKEGMLSLLTKAGYRVTPIY